MSKNVKTVVYVVLGLALIFAIASPKLDFLKGSNDVAAPEASGTRTVPVEVYIVEPEELEQKIFATGTVIANEEVELRSETSGKITHIYFDEGSNVRKGELLVKINDEELQAQLQKQQYQHQLAQDQENRQRQLLEQKLASQQNYDFALNELNKVKAEIAFLEAQIRKTEIHAPFDGTIGLRYVSTGSYITPTTRIASLINLNPIKIDFSIPERYANTVRKGDRFSFKIVGGQRVYEGTVFAVEPKIDQATRTLAVRGINPNPNKQILPGSFAEVQLMVQNLSDALMLPSVAVIPELQGQRIYLYRGGKAESRQIQTGIRTETKVQVLDGVQPGDTVITSGLLQIRPGSDVTITNFVPTD